MNQHRWSIHVWVEILNGYIIGPHFFERTINDEIYLDFLRNYLPDHLEEISLDVRQSMWFQQDGVPALYYQRVSRFLRWRYQDRLIMRNSIVASKIS